MTDMDMPPLLPCPMCGSKDGYTLGTGPTYRWWNMNCNGCGRIVDECASDRRHDFDSKLPDRWPAADEAWNEAGAYAAAEVAKERERIRAAIMAKHEAANGQHNLYHCLAVELFGDEAIRAAAPPQCTSAPSEPQ